MTYEAPAAPQSIGGVLDNWLRLFRQSFRYCWVLALIAAIANAAQQFVLIPNLPHANVSLVTYFSRLGSAYRMPKVFLTDIVFLLVLLTMYGALIAQQLTLVRGNRPASVSAALNASLSRLLPMLFGVVLLVLMEGIPFGLIGLGAAVLIPMHHSLLAALLITLTIIGLLILILYLSVRVQLWLVALFDTDCGGAAAIGRSWRLIGGHWWRTTSINFVAAIVIWILSLVVSLIAAAIAGWFSLTGGALGVLYHLRLIAAIGTLSRVLTMPLVSAVWVAIYHDLTLRREGGDLAARAEALSR